MEKVGVGIQNLGANRLSDEQKAQVRKAIVEQYSQCSEENKLARSPKEDKYLAACCSISPKTVTEGVISLTALVTALRTLAQTGFDIWDEFVERFGKPASKEEEVALKAALNIEG